MEVIIRPDTDAAAGLTASIIADTIRAKPDLVLGLATGRTMERLYARLAQTHEEEDLSFAQVHTFNLDEYIGLAPEDKHSYRHYMNEHLFNKVDIDPANTHLPNGIADNIDEECALYEQRITNAGGIDLQILGIGNTGHIGFNEPLSAMFSRTRAKALTPRTVEQNAPLFDNPEDMPRRAITMGVGTILDAKRCIMLATGKTKSEIIAKAVEGPVTSMISATALQLHAKATVIIDEPASASLQQNEYYQWLFDNEPEWEPYR